MTIDETAEKALHVCKLRKWPLDPLHRAGALHLEVSEFIEAIRGKRGDPEEEAGDVLFTLMAVTQSNGLVFSRIVERLQKKMIEYETKPRYDSEVTEEM